MKKQEIKEQSRVGLVITMNYEYHFENILIIIRPLNSFGLRHPDFVERIDRVHYVNELLRAAARFGVNLSIHDVRQYGDLGFGSI
ncbi:MAG: hypothetical protein ACFFCQ_07735 [Promethearchaeota archaeon]